MLFLRGLFICFSCWEKKKAYKKYFRKPLILLVRPAGIEPATKSLEGHCSILNIL